eukprot:Blabericola_migrator_1__4825@NODE_2533_length_2638_cov_124_569428_g523_i1_p2_GENE_NODE_2533_length_2638_cov_124_569428_g523_i1NODE_2533_length_2638_cov_124_569428_g523_i1_p2_ORF_typecomplete_len143_score18_54CTU2/PF10288_9/0_011_NODE_2533_length_2638_cov_124_569428_g523_i120382466
MGADCLILPHCQEEVAAELMSHIINGDLEQLGPRLMRSSPNDQKPMKGLQLLSETSLAELRGLAKVSNQPLDKKTNILESFFVNEMMMDFPSVSSNVIKSLGKVQLEPQPVCHICCVGVADHICHRCLPHSATSKILNSLIE